VIKDFALARDSRFLTAGAMSEAPFYLIEERSHPMKNLFRFLAFAALAAATLAPLACAQSERLTLTVAMPVRIAGVTLAPGAYEIEQSPVRGVFTIANKDTAHRLFVTSSSETGRTIEQSPLPEVATERDSGGQLAITSLYFPQTGATYRFSLSEAKKAADMRAALRR
jgi:hypothetical protein